MHRARGASVPSRRRRRIRRPGRARRAAVQRQDPRCPRVRRWAPIVPWARTTGPPPGRPQPARSPQCARRLGAASSGPRRWSAGPWMHVNLEKVAGAPARTSAAGRGRPWPGALSFSSGTKVPRGAGRGRGDRILRATLWRGPVIQCREAGAGRRGAARCGTGKVGPGCALRWRHPEGDPPCEELREKAPLRSLPLRRIGREAFGVQDSDRWPRACAAVGAIAQRGAASGRVPPARARPPTCAPRITVGFKATPEDGKCISHFHYLVNI